MKIKTNDTTDVFAALIIFSFFIVAFIISLSQFVWIDEGFTFTTVDAKLSRVWHRALIFEGQPPLYFVSLAAWRFISDSVFFTRLFSILSVTFSLFIVYRILKKYLSSVNPITALVFFASIPFVLWTALEVRVYAFVLLLSVITIYLYLEIYVHNSEKPKTYKRVLYSLIAFISIYTQYYLAFLFIVNFLYLLLTRNWKSSKRYLIDMIFPVLSSLYLILIYLPLQMSIHSYTTRIPVTLNELFSVNTHKISTYLFPFINSYSSVYRYLFVLVIIFVIVFYSKKSILNIIVKPNYFLFITLFLILIFTGLVFITDPKNLLQRHTIILLLPLVVSFLLFIGSIKADKVKYSLIGLLVFINISYSFKYYVLGHPKGREYVEICDYIKENDRNNEPVFCYRNDISLMIKHYGLPNKIVQIPEDINFDAKYDRTKWVFRDTLQLDSLFSANDINNGFWLVMSESDSANRAHNYRYGIIYKYDEMLDYVSNHFNIVSMNKFNPGFVLREVKPKAVKNK